MEKKEEYKVIPVRTEYIEPGEGFSKLTLTAGPMLKNGDFLVVSETPISVAQGRLVDESKFKPSIAAIIIADLWSKYLWGYILGPALGVKKRTIENLRKLPVDARAHKELVLHYYGYKHALKPASEAGIDLSNVPGTYVSLLPDRPDLVAREIANEILNRFKKDVAVIIIDTDATYSLRGRFFTCLPLAVPGIRHNTGIFGYIVGRFSKRAGPTPLASSKKIELEELIKIASIAESYHENSGGRNTVYDMARELEDLPKNITVEMLRSLEHSPAVIVRKR